VQPESSLVLPTSFACLPLVDSHVNKDSKIFPSFRVSEDSVSYMLSIEYGHEIPVVSSSDQKVLSSIHISMVLWGIDAGYCIDDVVAGVSEVVVAGDLHSVLRKVVGVNEHVGS